MSGWPLDGIDPAAFGSALSQLPPTHELVAAARAAVDIADARHDDAVTVAAAGRDAGKDCRGLAAHHQAMRTALAARADIDNHYRLAKFEAPLERDHPSPAANPTATAAAVDMARAWADDNAAALDARQAELSQWHVDQAAADQARSDTTVVPEQATAPDMERVR